MAITKVTRNFQITMPLDIRTQAKISEGDKLIMTLDNNEIKLKKFDEDIFDKPFGSWSIAEDSVTYVKEVRKGWAKRKKRNGL